MPAAPAVVEVQPVSIGISGGTNERDRTETADWKSSLATCENYVVNPGGALSRRKGMYIVAAGDDSGNAIWPTHRSLLTRGNTQGIYANQGQFYEWSESYQKYVNKGKASEFGVKNYVASSSDFGDISTANDAAFDTGGYVLVGVVPQDTGRPTSSSMSSKYAAVTGLRGAGGYVAIVDRQSKQTVREYIIGTAYTCVCTFSSDDRYLYVFRSDGVSVCSYTAIDTTSMPAESAALTWTAVGGALVSFDQMHCCSYSSYAILMVSNSTTHVTEITRVNTTGVGFTTATINSFAGSGIDTNENGYIYVVGINVTPKHEIKLVNAASLAVDFTKTSTLAIKGNSPRIAVDASGNMRVVSHNGEANINAYNVPTGWVYKIQSTDTDFTLLGAMSGWSEMAHPFCDRGLTGRFYAIVSKTAQGNSTAAGYLDAEPVSNCVIADITSSMGPAYDAHLSRWRIAASVDNYTCLNMSSKSDSGQQYLTLPKPRAYSNVYGFVYNSKISDSSRSYVFSELTTIDPSQVHMAGDCMSGGVVQHYDGHAVTESGFVDRPSLTLKESATATSYITAGVYSYCAVFVFTGNNGTVTYSRTSEVVSITATGGKKITVQCTQPTLSSRSANAIAVKVYRTEVNGTQMKYLATIYNSDGGYTFMAQLTDATPDDVLGGRPVMHRQPENAGTALDRFYAPHAAHIIQHKDRYVAASSSVIYYTSFFVDGEAPWWNPAFYIPVPGVGDVTGLASLDGNLIIFKENSIYVVSGEGPPENGGTGNEFSSPERITCEYGCIDARSVVATPVGVFFRSRRGLELLTKKLQVGWVGESVRTTVDTYPVITGACHNKGDNRVYFMLAASTDQYGNVNGSSGVTCVYDITHEIWTIFRYTPYGTLGEAMQDCTYAKHLDSWKVMILSRTYPFYEHDTTYKLDYVSFVNSTIETHWIKSTPNDRIRLHDCYYLAKQLDANHAVKISVGYDYDTTYTYSKTWDPGSLSSIEDLMLQIPKPLGRAFRFKIEQLPPTDTVTYPIGSGLGSDILDVTVMLGVKGGGYKTPPAQRG